MFGCKHSWQVTGAKFFCHKLTFSQEAGKPSLPGYVWKDLT